MSLLCQLRSIPDHPFTHVEKLVHAVRLPGVLSPVQRNHNRDLFGQRQQFTDDQILHRGKTGKTVQKNNTVLYQ